MRAWIVSRVAPCPCHWSLRTVCWASRLSFSKTPHRSSRPGKGRSWRASTWATLRAAPPPWELQRHRAADSSQRLEGWVPWQRFRLTHRGSCCLSPRMGDGVGSSKPSSTGRGAMPMPRCAYPGMTYGGRQRWASSVPPPGQGRSGVPARTHRSRPSAMTVGLAQHSRLAWSLWR
jgi:hypothetical protein